MVELLRTEEINFRQAESHEQRIYVLTCELIINDLLVELIQSLYGRSCFANEGNKECSSELWPSRTIHDILKAAYLVKDGKTFPVEYN